MRLVFSGFVLIYNPWYVYYLMANGAIGGISIRAKISGVFLCFAIFYKTLSLLAGNVSVGKRSSVLTLMTSFLLVFLISIVIGLVNGNEFLYFGLDAFPLFEMFCLYYLIRLTPDMDLDFEKLAKWISLYIILMCVANIATYIYLSFFQGIGFGALRANINGVVVNRLMDFMVPILGPGFIVMSRVSKNRFIRIFLPACVVLLVGLTFFRTAYVAFFAGFFVILTQKKKNIIILAKTVGVAMALGLSAITVAQQRSGANSDLHMVGLITERVSSIFDSKDDDLAIYSRITDTADKIKELPKALIVGYGMGGELDSGPIQYTANYFLQLLLLLGVPGGVLFIWIYIKIARVLLWLSRTAVDQTEKLLFLAGASSLGGLAAILMFFPYTMYFPLLYLFGILAGIADICYLRRKKQLALKVKIA